MIDHLSTYAKDYAATKKFYRDSLAVLGYHMQEEYVAGWNKDFPNQRVCAFGPEKTPIFWIIEVKESYTPRHIAFSAANRDAVDSFHKAAMKSGGRDNGKPGLRNEYHEHYYGAFALDPDGNNIEAVCHLPE
ncbi:VOC family protein [Microbulbifer marinus]|uniref:Catechol 2,3-dioxygenase n=1 Tax=Microbulbifer marinus TaxID=658218 RepID=A0A1H4A6X2_9GAMM|nr:VOC family protein [Microbulbifer marinus]SEA31735.1 Catechol 2,3-dioxygenase [Microbulbifer marinus]